MRRWALGGLLSLGAVLLPGMALGSDYAQEISGQAAEVEKNYPQKNANYFHDMGIIVRKAEDAGLSDQAAGMIRDLMKKMDEFTQKELEDINAQFYTDAFHAARRLPDLTRADRYYQPTESFLGLALGQSLNTDLIQFRENALSELKKNGSDLSILHGIQAIKKTGLFMTGSRSEIQALRDLADGVSCAVSWKPEMSFSRSQEFQTPYEMGLSTEAAVLRLDSNRADWAEARWSGEWFYRVSGREGRGEGVSQATLVYRKGEDFATLRISPSRVTSVGRMNFPNALSGEKRTLSVTENPINPSLDFFGQPLRMTGCRAEMKSDNNSNKK